MKKFLAILVLLLAVSSLSVLAVECTDSDGGINPFWKGAISDSNSISGSLKQDNCFDRATLFEYSCANPDGEKIECEFGCSEGACLTYGTGPDQTLDECFDTDPEDSPYIVGSIVNPKEANTNLNTVSEDYCFDRLTLFEQNCEGGMKIPCPQGCNPKGYCEQRGSVPQTHTECIDTDGGKDYFVQGAVSYPNKPASTIQRDYCIEEAVLIEQTCEGTFRVECVNDCAAGTCTGNRVDLEGVEVEDAEVYVAPKVGDSEEDSEDDSTEVEVDTESDSKEDKKETKSKTWLWVIIVVIIIAIIYFAASGKDEKKKEE